MPAPVPIQIRYGPDGLLAQAAMLVGHRQGQQELADRTLAANQQQKAGDLSLIAQNLAQQAQQNQADIRQQQEFRASQSASAPAGLPAPQQQQPNYFVGTGSLGDSTRAMKSLALSNILGDSPVDDATKNTLTHLAGRDDVPLSQVTALAKEAATSATTKAERVKKQDYARQVAGSLDSANSEAIQALAESDNVSLPQLRMAVSDAVSKSQATKKSDSAQKIDNIESKARPLLQQMKILDKQLRDAGVDPDAATVNDFGIGAEVPIAQPSFWDRLSQGSIHPTTISQGDTVSLDALKKYRTIRVQLEKLQKDRDHIVNGDSQSESSATAAPAKGTSPAASSVKTMSDDELLRALSK